MDWARLKSIVLEQGVIRSETRKFSECVALDELILTLANLESPNNTIVTEVGEIVFDLWKMSSLRELSKKIKIKTLGIVLSVGDLMSLGLTESMVFNNLSFRARKEAEDWMQNLSEQERLRLFRTGGSPSSRIIAVDTDRI